MDNKTKLEQQFIRIRYEDERGDIKDAIISLHDYIESDSYRENMDRAITDLCDGGGFWLNSDTVIPYHQVKSVHSHKTASAPSSKQNRKRPKRRIKSRTTTTTTEALERHNGEQNSQEM